MRLDQFSGIVAFVKVAEAKSFTRAAAELGVAPASLSEAVKGLEERLGVRLLNRTTRSVGLTEAGAHYLDQRPKRYGRPARRCARHAISPPARCA